MGPRTRGLLLGLLLAVLAALPARAVTPLTAEEIAAWRQDLRTFAEEAPRRHKNLFHTMTREQFQAALQSLEERLPRLQRHEIIVELARLVARVGDGHTHVRLWRPGANFRYYPVKLYLFTDGLFVLAASREHAAAVGGRVVRIGSGTAEQVLQAVDALVPRDNQMTARWWVAGYAATPEILNALGFAPDMESLPLVVEKDGRRVTVRLRPLTTGPDFLHGWLPGPEWVDMRDTSRPLPLWLKDPTNRYWFEYLPDSRTLYVQYNAVAQKEEETIAAFFRRVLQFAEANPVDHFVLDARLNSGGNNFLNLPIIHAFIRSDKVNQPGKLFTIIGRQTFSAAQNLVNQLEKHTHTLFVGEPTGATPNHYGDTVPLELPNSKVVIPLSSLWWQDVDPRDRRPWRAPDIAAEMASTDYRIGRDPALEAILAYASKPSVASLVRAAVEKSDLAAARRALAEFKADPANKYASAELAINSLGYELLNARQLEHALEVFKLNTEAYPEAFNTWDSLAEAHMVRGEKELAIQNYEKSLALNPNNQNAVAMLVRLRRP